jgi:hypothetical protein
MPSISLTREQLIALNNHLHGWANYQREQDLKYAIAKIEMVWEKEFGRMR